MSAVLPRISVSRSCTGSLSTVENIWHLPSQEARKLAETKAARDYAREKERKEAL